MDRSITLPHPNLTVYSPFPRLSLTSNLVPDHAETPTLPPTVPPPPLLRTANLIKLVFIFCVKGVPILNVFHYSESHVQRDQVIVQLASGNHLAIVVDDGDLGGVAIGGVQTLGGAGHGSGDDQANTGTTVAQHHGNLEAVAWLGAWEGRGFV